MPKVFDNCVRAGGKVRTKSLSSSRYMKICIKGGKSVGGHVQTKKSVGNKYTKALGGVSR